MKELTSGNEARIIFNFAMPMLLGNLFQQLYNIVDTIIVGNFLGKEALAAVGASFPIVFTLISLIIGVASGGTIVIAQYFGAGDGGNRPSRAREGQGRRRGRDCRDQKDAEDSVHGGGDVSKDSG